MGRKKLDKATKRKMISIRLPPWLLGRIKSTGKKTTGVIYDALKYYIRKGKL